MPLSVYASPIECPVNIYPKPVNGEGEYILSIRNNTSQVINSILVNFIPTNTFIRYNGEGFPTGWEPASAIWYALHSETTTSPLTRGNYISFPVHILVSTYFDGVDVGFGPNYGDWFCSGHYSPNEITYDKQPFNTFEPIDLNVLYFNQNNPPWGPTEYDHSLKLMFTNPTIDRWGCAVTSAAMILNFHNIKKMPNDTTLDPGSLNTWLKNNNGYAIGYNNMDGWYSYLKFPSISTLTQKIFDAGKSNIKLEYKRTKTNLNQVLDNDLNTNKFPDIIKVSNNQTTSHFVVAKGKTSSTYLINDPEWNHPTLESFNNTFNQLDRFVPSNTNLSYLLAVINPSVEMIITDPNNKRAGKNLSNNEELNDIDSASYLFQSPISNPNDSNKQENLGTGVNEFLLPEPIDGIYKIKLTSKQNGFYEMNLTTFKENGDNNSNYIRGIITENNDETLEINYSQTKNSYISKTFDDLIKDLDELNKLNQFKNDGIYNSLSVKVTVAQLSNFIDKKTSINILKATLNEIKAQRGKGITEDAYQILLYDVNYLKTHL
ncbi:MAG: C39 family peptidase [Patescibacteria group bacterium]